MEIPFLDNLLGKKKNNTLDKIFQILRRSFILIQSLPYLCTKEIQYHYNDSYGNKTWSNSTKILQDYPLPEKETNSSSTHKTDNRGGSYIDIPTIDR